MIDFNDAAPAPMQSSESQREEIRAALLGRLESVLLTLFPAGKVRRGKFLIGDILGSPGDSLEIVLQGDKAGLWTDRENGSGGDMFALIGGHFGIHWQSDFAAVLAKTAPGFSLELGTPERKIVDAVAEAISEAYIDQYLVGSLMDIESKAGLELEQWVGIFGFGRLQGRKATGTVRVAS